MRQLRNALLLVATVALSAGGYFVPFNPAPSGAAGPPDLSDIKLWLNWNVGSCTSGTSYTASATDEYPASLGVTHTATSNANMYHDSTGALEPDATCGTWFVATTGAGTKETLDIAAATDLALEEADSKGRMAWRMDFVGVTGSPANAKILFVGAGNNRIDSFLYASTGDIGFSVVDDSTVARSVGTSSDTTSSCCIGTNGCAGDMITMGAFTAELAWDTTLDGGNDYIQLWIDDCLSYETTGTFGNIIWSAADPTDAEMQLGSDTLSSHYEYYVDLWAITANPLGVPIDGTPVSFHEVWCGADGDCTNGGADEYTDCDQGSPVCGA